MLVKNQVKWYIYNRDDENYFEFVTFTCKKWKKALSYGSLDQMNLHEFQPLACLPKACQQWLKDELMWMAVWVGDENIHITTRWLPSSVWPTHHHLCIFCNAQGCLPYLLGMEFLGCWCNNLMSCQLIWPEIDMKPKSYSFYQFTDSVLMLFE